MLTMSKKISKDRAERILSGGGEPVFKGIVFTTDEEYSHIVEKAMMWYRENYKPNSSKQWLSVYLTSVGRKEDASICGRGSKGSIRYVAPYCRMVARGLVLNEQYKKLIDKNIEEVLSSVRKMGQKQAEVPNIQERIHAKAGYFLADLEGVLDVVHENILKGKKKVHPISDWIKKMEWNRPIILIIRERLARSLTEWKLAGTDPDLAEGYSYLNKKQLKNLIEEVESADMQLVEIFNEQVSNRKPRKKKKKNPEQLVKGLKYCEKNIEHGIDSKSPCDIIGSQGIIMYNKKNKKVTVFVSQEPKAGLSVKGSTIIGFNPTESFEKAIRKVDDFMKEAKRINCTFASLCKYLSFVKTKSSTPTGRVNLHCVILQT